MIRFVIILLGIFLFAKEPLWIHNVYPKDNAKYFLGESPRYLTADALVEQKAIKDALNQAYVELSSYFGVNIKSDLKIENTVINNYYVDKNMNQTIETKTNQLIFDVKPYKIYKKVQGDYFRIYVLLRLDKATEVKIKKQIEKEKKEFKKLEDEIITAINNQNFFKAKNLLALLKKKRVAYMYEDEIKAIENRLNYLLENQLTPSIVLNNNEYLPDETINLEVSLNKKGYLYILYDTGSEIDMIFPNEYSINNYTAGPITFPNDDIEIVAYKNSKPSIIVIASKERLLLRQYRDDSDGVYIFNSFNKIKKIIDKCQKEGKCVVVKKTFKVVNFKKSKYHLVINANPDLKKDIFSYLKQKGIKNSPTAKKIYITIKETKKYSKFLDDYITIFHLTIINNNEKISKTISSEDELLDEILKIAK